MRGSLLLLLAALVVSATCSSSGYTFHSYNDATCIGDDAQRVDFDKFGECFGCCAGWATVSQSGNQTLTFCQFSDKKCTQAKQNTTCISFPQNQCYQAADRLSYIVNKQGESASSSASHIAFGALVIAISLTALLFN
eukprot:Phypoly_transcript_22336.p1 GENE.Phypoly_transcript_22336~~Phypoly_transcript_22336.p1  ORF type:complete len:137 (+),score=11.08 Phypoly_transcript_22336:158-568(+)